MNISEDDLRSAEDSLRTARQELARVESHVARLRVQARQQYFPTEPPAIGTILKFTLRLKKYGGATKLYRYAAIKADTDRWYTTGSTCPPAGWDWKTLINFIRDADGIIGGLWSTDPFNNNAAWKRIEL